MERKTIGKFISALRRAKGLTQRELGDMLYVSDKTISRWENDECTPDLNLIPAIADIFGVTCDELLRGEKTSAAQSAAEQPAGDTAPPCAAKNSLKQFCGGSTPPSATSPLYLSGLRFRD